MVKPETQLPTTPRPPGPPKELLSSASFLLKRLGFAVKERMMDALEETGLSSYHHAILALLDEEPRETQAMIADALGFDRSHLVGVLDELEERGLIERRRDPDDRRRHLVSLTPVGKEALTQLRAVAKRVDDEFFEPLGAAERKTLTGLLARLASHHDARYNR
jgi:MarR family transcriptional regulator, lower aerobic nicotinate degradation pathway regulator